MLPAPQSALVTHSTQAIVARSHTFVLPLSHMLSLVQLATQVWAALQTRLLVHCVLFRHSTQAPPAVSQRWPFGQLVSLMHRTQALVVVLQTPGAQGVLFVHVAAQRWVVMLHVSLAAQSSAVRHSTHWCVAVLQRSMPAPRSAHS